VKFVGHRGAKGLVFENTLASIIRCIELGADAVEFDVHATKDNQLILHHDKSLNRMYSLDKKIRDMTLSEIKKATADYKYPVNSFEEIMEIVKDYPVFLELKDKPVTAELFLEKIKNFPESNIQKIISFEPGVLKQYQDLGGKLPIYLAPYKRNFLIAPFRAKKLNAKGMVLHYWSLFFILYIPFIKILGLDVIVYPVNSRVIASILRRLNPYGYICTDRPDLFCLPKKYT